MENKVKMTVSRTITIAVLNGIVGGLLAAAITIMLIPAFHLSTAFIPPIVIIIAIGLSLLGSYRPIWVFTIVFILVGSIGALLIFFSQNKEISEQITWNPGMLGAGTSIVALALTFYMLIMSREPKERATKVTNAEGHSPNTKGNETMDNKVIADPETLEFAYFEGQKILSHQVSAADTLDTKVITIFSVATVIIGVVPPLINSWISTQNMSMFKDCLALSLLILACVCYLIIFGFSLRSCWTRAFGLIPSLKFVYKKLDISPSDMRKVLVINHLMRAYNKNKEIIIHKAKTLRIVIITIGIEVLFLLLLLIRVSFLN